METPADKLYSHRFNADGTIDSICRRCFRTVAKVRQESDLEFCEREHICESQYMSHFDEHTEEATPSNPAHSDPTQSEGC
jgi:hypothetical protein